MNMKMIEVPVYVADEFNRPLRHPSKKANAVEISVGRVYRLINEALKDIDGADWEVGARQYHSAADIEPFGFERVDDKFYIYTEERGQRNAVAIFKNDHIAADYFVWLVSKGETEINWKSFLEMEP